MNAYNDLPIFRSAISMRALIGGVYVFTGSSAATFTLPSFVPTAQRQNGERIQYFKNAGTAALTLSPSGNLFDGVAVASIVLLPGESAIIVPDNNQHQVFRSGGLIKMPTASRPAWSAALVGLTYFDTTLNKIVVAGAAAYETVTSA